ncbi:MAG: gliding motility-associated C-terminal domain-containing protein [Bacteroidota bacterium]
MKFKKILFLSVFALLFSLSAFAQHSCCSYDFAKNERQWQPNILYRSSWDGGALFLEKDAFTFVMQNSKDIQAYKRATYHDTLPESLKKNNKISNIRHHAVRMRFINANQDVKCSSEKQIPGYTNYFLGKDKSRWASRVPSFEVVNYDNLYKGIDLKIHSSDGNLKYDYIVHPGSSASSIRIRVEGAQDVQIREENLVIKTSVSDLKELKPVAYQFVNGIKKDVVCRFALHRDVVTFDFPEGYDNTKDLIIDPSWIFGTYTGSTADNWGFTATFDKAGNVYSGGIVFDIGYPVSAGAYQLTFGGGELNPPFNVDQLGCDVGIIKYNTTGTTRLFATYLGGSRNELPHSLIINNSDELVIFGTTGSDNFPVTSGAFDTTFNGGTNVAYDNGAILFSYGIDIYVAKLSNDGTQLIASSYVGGTQNDGLNYATPLSYNYADGARGEVMIDRNDNVFVVSCTNSPDFPVTAGAYQTMHGGGGQDGCIFKMDMTLSSMLWSTFIGGFGNDAVYSIVIDKYDKIYMAGGTASTNFPTTTGVLYPSYNGGVLDGFVAELSDDGSTLLASTFYGTVTYDQVHFVRVDRNSNVYVMGQTEAGGMTYVHNAVFYQSGGGLFISKLTNPLDSLIWSTVFDKNDGRPDLSPSAFLVDYCNKIYFSGWGGAVNGFGGTNGLLTTPLPFQASTDNSDYYLMVINDDASALVYATFYGGGVSAEHVDGGTSRFDKAGRIYQSVCAGCGGNSDFPTTPGAWSNTNNSSNCNNGVFKFDFNLPIVVADFDVPPVICAPDTMHFNNTSIGGIQYSWDFGDGTGSTQTSPDHLYTLPGMYNVTLIATDTGACNTADTLVQPVMVLSNSPDTLLPQSICHGGDVQIGFLPAADTSIHYTWSPVSTLSSGGISNPVASPTVSTTYSVTVTNYICTAVYTQIVSVSNISVNAGPDTSSCMDTLKMIATSGGGINHFIWSTNHFFTDTINTSVNDSTASIFVTGPHWYYVMVDDGICTAIDSMFIGLVSMNTTANSTNSLCFYDCNGSVFLSTTGGTPPYTYAWSNGSSNDTLQNLCAGPLYLTITDNVNCKMYDTVNITAPPPVTALPVTVNACYGICSGLISVNASGGTPGYTYAWNNSATTSSQQNLCPGIYTVTITDSHLCDTIVSDTVHEFPSNPPVTAWADNDTLYEGQSTIIHASPPGVYTYQWTPTEGLENPNAASTTATLTQTTTFIVNITDIYGCTNSDTVTIYVTDVACDENDIYIPNAFTPNGDNVNDVLYVRSPVIEILYFAVYDRWGERVFETRDINQGWDGTFRGKPSDPDVFYYYIEAGCYNKEKFFKKGNITLIR